MARAKVSANSYSSAATASAPPHSSPRGELVATATFEGTSPPALTLWDVATGRQGVRIADAGGTGTAARSILGRRHSTGHGWRSRRLALGGEKIGHVARAATLENAGRRGHTRGRHFTGRQDRGSRRRRAKLSICWTLQLEPRRASSRATTKAEVSALSFSPDGSLLASGGYDRSVRLWQMPDGKGLPAMRGDPHADWVTGLVFTPDGGRSLLPPTTAPSSSGTSAREHKVQHFAAQQAGWVAWRSRRIPKARRW